MYLALSQAIVRSHPHPTPSTADDRDGSEPAPGLGELGVIPLELDAGYLRICSSMVS